jgi:hypothetical protein
MALRPAALCAAPTNNAMLNMSLANGGPSTQGVCRPSGSPIVNAGLHVVAFACLMMKQAVAIAAGS